MPLRWIQSSPQTVCRITAARPKRIALVFGSPAIDKGVAGQDPSTSAALTTDQRGPGFPRTFNDSIIANASGGDGTDIGAFELQIALPPRLANISTRLRVDTGDRALIGGFIDPTVDSTLANISYALN